MKYISWALILLCIACTQNKSPYKKSYHIEESRFHANPDKASSMELQNINPVLLISLDGYRADYTKKYQPKFIKKFANEGTQLKSLIPSYPTKTFPNHLSIATGTYPMNHGIVGNSFFAPELNLSYSLKDRGAVKNEKFYEATPIWSAAEEQGLRTATLFWPGSEAEISGYRPTYWYDYIHTMPHEDRVNQIIEWLKLPENRRPSFITLYFPDVDSAGHHHGTDSKEVRDAIAKVDHTLEGLIKQARSIIPNINIMIVSDHGMLDVDEGKMEEVLKTPDLKGIKDTYRIYGAGPIIQFYSKVAGNNIKQDLQNINAKAKNFKCYMKNDIPQKYHFKTNSRIGDFACLADSGYWISAKDSKYPKASHGWDQFSNESMHGIFYASGPDFKNSYIAPSKENVNIFPLILRILGLDNHYQIDGKIENIQDILNQ